MAAPAAAIDPVETEQLPTEDDREFLLAPPAAPDERPRWLAGDNFHIAKKAGIGYTRRLKFGERALRFSVRGPVMRKQKALGLAFRIRF
jgi:hypothetical protein